MKTSKPEAAHRGGRDERSRFARRALVPVLLFGVLLAGAAARLPAANIDLVVMVDTSESMFPYFDDLMNYLVQNLLTEKLHRGDTFHLLSFSSVPEVEIALDVNSDEAAQRAFGRILLLHALGRYTDLVSALQFLSSYTHELPETNPKQIILITDGVHDPPPGSPNRGTPESIAKAVDDAVQSMARQGWTFNLLRVPPEAAPGEQGLKSYLPDIAKTLGVPVVPYAAADKQSTTGRTTGFPDLIFPPALGKVGSRFTAPFKVKNWKQEPIIVRLTGLRSDGVELLERAVSVTVPAAAEAALDVPLRLPASYPVGDHQAGVQLVFADDLRISPTSGTINFTFTGKGGFPFPRLTFLYVVYIVLGIAVLYLLVRLFLFMRRRLGEASVAGLGRGAPRPSRKVEAAHDRAETAQAAAAGTGARPHSPLLPRASGRKLVPLLGASAEGAAAAAAGSAPGAANRRVRPTVTSLRRALPHEEMRQASLPPLIEMRVSLQNHRIGFRNVHRIVEGGSRSVGGRFSSFLVFLVPVPSSIGEIRNVEGSYVFTPLRPELFPGLSGPVEDCLGKEIPFIAPKGRELSLHFRQWTSPLEEINSLLRMTRDQD
jgi:hypothetical protein